MKTTVKKPSKKKPSKKSPAKKKIAGAGGDGSKGRKPYA